MTSVDLLFDHIDVQGSQKKPYNFDEIFLVNALLGKYLK